jgi:hypothetical protein
MFCMTLPIRNPNVIKYSITVFMIQCLVRPRDLRSDVEKRNIVEILVTSHYQSSSLSLSAFTSVTIPSAVNDHKQ